MTGVARNSSGRPVIVVARHVATGIWGSEAIGNEKLFQGQSIADDMVGKNIKWIAQEEGDETPIDIAIFDPVDSVSLASQIHSWPSATHTGRRVVRGTVDAVAPEDGISMELTIVGGFTNEFNARVMFVDHQQTIFGITFTGLVVLSAFERPIEDGDSGSPAYYVDENGEYRLCCVVIASNENGSILYAVPASKVESQFGITFGNTPPLANAGKDRKVLKRLPFFLDSAGSHDPDGDPLIYSWKQLLKIAGTPHVRLHTGKLQFGFGTARRPMAFAPNRDSRLTFELTVEDSFGETDTAEVEITVGKPPANEVPATPEVPPQEENDEEKPTDDEPDEEESTEEQPEQPTEQPSDEEPTDESPTEEEPEEEKDPSTWVDTGKTRNATFGTWEDTGRVQQDPVTDEWEKEQKALVTYEKQRIDSLGNVTDPQWVEATRYEYRWVTDTPDTPEPTPPPTPTPDPDPTPPTPTPDPDASQAQANPGSRTGRPAGRDLGRLAGR